MTQTTPTGRTTSNWRDVRARANLNEERVAEHTQRMLAEVRAHRLAELRRRQELSQEAVAQAMQVSQGRVSAIERGDVAAAELSTIRRYVAALGGRLEIVADFGDERLVIG